MVANRHYLVHISQNSQTASSNHTLYKCDTIKQSLFLEKKKKAYDIAITQTWYKKSELDST